MWTLILGYTTQQGNVSKITLEWENGGRMGRRMSPNEAVHRRVVYTVYLIQDLFLFDFSTSRVGIGHRRMEYPENGQPEIHRPM